MMSKYTPELKDKVLRLYFEEGRTQVSFNEEYHLGNIDTINSILRFIYIMTPCSFPIYLILFSIIFLYLQISI